MAIENATTASAAQRVYFATILVPLWQGQLDQLAAAERAYRWHLLALECLRVAKGPGVDLVRVAEFCRTWKIPLTLPVVGPTALLRRIGKAAVGGPSAATVFDPTGALNVGVKIVSQMAPLLGQLQMRSALLVALDDKVVEAGDQGNVGSILESAQTPQHLMIRVGAAKSTLERIWNETVALAEKMEPVRKELGLPET